MNEKLTIVIDKENFETSPEELDEKFGSPDSDYDPDEAYQVDEVEIIFPKEVRDNY